MVSIIIIRLSKKVIEEKILKNEDILVEATL